MLPAREKLGRSKLKCSIKMTGILYLPSTAADLGVKEDTITEVWVWVFF